MRFDTRTGLVLKQAARGPAAIALRQNRILRPTQMGVDQSAGVIQSGLPGPGLLSGTGRRRGNLGSTATLTGARLVGGGVGSQSMGASQLVSAGTGGVPGGLTGYFTKRGVNLYQYSNRLPRAFGALGIAASTEQYGKQVGETAGTAAATGAIMGSAATSTTAATGLTAALQAAGYGGMVGPIGAAVGLIIGIAISQLLKKNYINVAQASAAQEAEAQLFDKYKAIQGKVPGRVLGMDVMGHIWKGSQHRGYFGKGGAGVTQCFHEGCFKYPGRSDWIDSDYSNNKASWQWGAVFDKWQAGRRTGAVSVQQNMAPRAVIVAPTSRMVMRATALRGLGSFGQVSQVSDAVSFVDNYYIPAVCGTRGAWACPSNTLEHNMLYDLADAYLAAQPGVTTTPYVGIPNAEYGLPPAPPPVTTPAPAGPVPPASQTQVTTSYPGYTYIGSDAQGHQLYLANSDGGKINQNIPIYTPVGGVMTPTGQTFFNAAATPVGPVVQPAPTPGNTYPLTPVSTPSGGTVYQPNPAAPTAAVPAAAPGMNWGAIVALAAGAITLMR